MDSMHRERLIMIQAIFAQQQGLKNDSNTNLSFKEVISFSKGLISVSALIPYCYCMCTSDISSYPLTL
jgi:hypothetical protein